MKELKFFPISEWHITNCRSETDNRKYIVKMIGNKGKYFVMKGTEIMTDMAYGQFVSEFAIL